MMEAGRQTLRSLRSGGGFVHSFTRTVCLNEQRDKRRLRLCVAARTDPSLTAIGEPAIPITYGAAGSGGQSGRYRPRCGPLPDLVAICGDGRSFHTGQAVQIFDPRFH